MGISVIVHVGSRDRFRPKPLPSGGSVVIPLESPENPLSVRFSIRDQLQRWGLSLPVVVEDLLRVAVATYAADIRISRARADDGWTRELKMYLPVSDVDRWAGMGADLARMLAFLTGDRWEFEFRAFGREVPTRIHQQSILGPDWSVVSLLSGGLDSFVGAIDLLEHGSKAFFVGHYDQWPTSRSQDRIASILTKHYGEARVPFLKIWLRPPLTITGEREPTARSRALLFLSLGVTVASSIGPEIPVCVPENGFISLNAPLTSSRLGSLSTRSTHPYFLRAFRRLLAGLGLPLAVENPYAFKTKGEMVAEVQNTRVLGLGLRHSRSCAHPTVGRWQKGGDPNKHCGYCFPCILRRAALATVGLDRTRDYMYDVLRDALPAHTERGLTRRALEIAVESSSGEYQLADLMRAGPLEPVLGRIGDHVSVYQRGLKELEQFLQSSRR